MKFNLTDVWGALASFSLAILLFAPPLKARFNIADLLAYQLPTAIFGVMLLLMLLTNGGGSISRLKSACIYLILIVPIVGSFLLEGAVEGQLFSAIMLNFMLAISITVFPWREKEIHLFFFACTILATLLAIHTLLFFGSDNALVLAADTFAQNYLYVSLTIGYGCIASFYLLVRKLSIFNLSLFLICWVGLALARGRGAFLIGVLVLVVYLAYALSANIGSLKKSKKFAIATLVIISSPAIAMFLLSLGMNRAKWHRLLFEFDSEVSDGGRGALMSQALQKIADSPLYGHGLGEYMFYAGHPHNIILQYGVDGGILSIVFLLTFLFIAISRSRFALKFAHPKQKNISMAILCIFSFILLNMMKSSDAYLGRDFFILSAFALSAPLALKQLNRRKL